MATARDLIEASLRELCVLAAGEPAPSGDADDALDALNRLIDQWASENMMIYAITRTTWTISANDGSYTVGSGADISITRPIFVEHVGYIDTATDPDTEHTLTRLTDESYERITHKAQTATAPSHWWYNPTVANATLELWPVPTSGWTGVIYHRAAFGTLAALGTTVTAPRGYERMIVKNLAVDLAPSYGRQVSQVLMEQAKTSKADAKRANKRLYDLYLEPGALIGSDSADYDINAG